MGRNIDQTVLDYNEGAAPNECAAQEIQFRLSLPGNQL